jgi:hypothetical protein
VTENDSFALTLAMTSRACPDRTGQGAWTSSGQSQSAQEMQAVGNEHPERIDGRERAVQKAQSETVQKA